MRGISRKIAWGLLASFLLSVISAPVSAQQCVPYARQNSTIFLRGDAWTWWKGAEGKYAKSNRPEIGSVLVFQKTKKMRRGHVAVIKEVVDSRKVMVDHANWAPRGTREKGKVAKNIAVIDVSPRNDWSMVRVWYKPLGDFGARTYPTYGFIHDRNPKGGKVKNARFAPAPALENDVFDDSDDDGDTSLTVVDDGMSMGLAARMASMFRVDANYGDRFVDLVDNLASTPIYDEFGSVSGVAPGNDVQSKAAPDSGAAAQNPMAEDSASGEMSSADEIQDSVAQDSVTQAPGPMVAMLDLGNSYSDIP